MRKAESKHLTVVGVLGPLGHQGGVSSFGAGQGVGFPEELDVLDAEEGLGDAVGVVAVEPHHVDLEGGGGGKGCEDGVSQL